MEITSNTHFDHNYFPVTHKFPPPRANDNDLIEEFQKTAKVVNQFNVQCSNMDEKTLLNFEIFTMKSIGFLVEATQQLSPENWKNELSALRERLVDISTKNGGTNYAAKTEATWLIFQTISTLQALSLDEKMLLETQNNSKSNIENIQSEKKTFSNFSKLMNIYHKRGVVNYPPIPTKLLPDWFFKAYPKATPRGDEP